MELIEAITTAGTCRYFRPDPVPLGVLATAIDAARFAPQGGNRQPVRFVVVTDAEKRRTLARWYLESWAPYAERLRQGSATVNAGPRMVDDADHFARHLADVPALLVVCAVLGDTLPMDAHLDRLSVVGGCSIYPAVQNVLLRCRDLGLGAALTTILVHHEVKVKELLGIPPEVSTVAHVAIGWPARRFPSRLTRRPLAEMAFLDCFGAPLAPLA